MASTDTRQAGHPLERIRGSHGLECRKKEEFGADRGAARRLERRGTGEKKRNGEKTSLRRGESRRQNAQSRTGTECCASEGEV